MARAIHRLSPLKIKKLGPGLHSDGLNLYLQVSESGARSWIFLYSRGGKSTSVGLGSIHTTTLAEARDIAHDLRRLLRDGVDPLEARRAAKAQKALAHAKTITFENAAKQYITAHCTGWRNLRHASQWRDSLATYAFPVLGALPVRSIDTGLIMQVLEPIWGTIPDTAARLRGRIESIWDWAKVKAFCEGENPARWRGHLDKLLPKKSKVRKPKHHTALPYREMPAFLVEVRKQQGIAARALEFTVLTAVRSGEALGARWSEIDLTERVWSVPAERMKGGREHRVPLSDRAVETLEEMQASRDVEGDFVFPGGQRGKPLSENAMYVRLRRMGCGDLTVHGLRSTFRDWAAEQTSYANHVVEQALAHAISNAVEAAYRRSDLFEHRRRLMQEWALFCAAPRAEGEVVPIRAAVS
jgi:integrase